MVVVVGAVVAFAIVEETKVVVFLTLKAGGSSNMKLWAAEAWLATEEAKTEVAKEAMANKVWNCIFILY